MKVIVAKTAGFCFGVDRALKVVEKEIDGSKISTYGPIIHNKHVISSLRKRGVETINSLDRLDEVEADKIVVRSHGVGKDEEMKIKSKTTMVQATCPYVKKIHKIVENASSKGHKIIIIGDKNHSEVKGISGWSSTDVLYIKDLEEAKNIELKEDETYQVVVQTTFNHKLFKEIVTLLQNRFFHVIIKDTICSATFDRQTEALNIAKTVDIMIVIGDKSSSNTKKLYEICKGVCDRTYQIESFDDFDVDILKGDEVVGITAGASTPKKLIEEVISNVRNAK